MAAITAGLVKALRERTGSGMMECKRALVDADGDIEAAVVAMRKAGLAKADKRAGRVAAEGVIAMSGTERAMAMVEVNCETDFVAKGEDFRSFADTVAAVALSAAPADLEALGAAAMPGGAAVDQARRELVAKIGENIALRRFARFEAETGRVAGYLHGTRIGVLVEIEGGDVELARDLAMHIAASKPVCVGQDQVPAEMLEAERAIYAAQAKESGKPEGIIEKMVQGRLRKYLNEVTLLGQPFVKDTDRSVRELLEARGARVLGFRRFELGEGVERRSDDFAAEVMAQVRGA